MRRFWVSLVVCSCVAGAATPAYAVLYELENTFISPSPSTVGSFGFSVAGLEGDVLVGENANDTGAFNSGAVHLFNGVTGDLVRTFLNPSPAANDGFGFAAAGHTGKILVGVPLANEAYLFDASTGNLLRTFVSPHPNGSGEFGRSVAFFGNDVLVGERHGDEPTSQGRGPGVAYLFSGETGDLIRTFHNPNSASDDQFTDSFGVSVATFGNEVPIGAPFEDAGAHDAGAAYLFNPDTGELLRTFVSPSPSESGSFGISVAGIDGKGLIGAVNDSAVGAAYLFDASTGGILQTFSNPSLTSLPACDDFGYSLAFAGANALIGTFPNCAEFPTAGSAYLFNTQTGNLLQSFMSTNPAPFDRFGFSVASVGDDVLIGAPQDSRAGDRAGAAYLYRIAPVEQGGPVVPEPSSLFLLGSGLLGLIGCRRQRPS